MSYQAAPSGRAVARGAGTNALEEYRARRASRGCIRAEAACVALTVGTLLYVGTALSGPTSIAIGIGIVIAVTVLFRLPVIGVLASIGVSMFWGMVAFNLLTGYGNALLGAVGAVVIGFLSLRLHVGARR